MAIRLLECGFFIPLVRNSDRETHQPVHWRLFTDEIRRVFPAGHTGPENFYRGDSIIPGEYEDDAGQPPIKDESHRYLLAIPESRVEELRSLLRRAAVTFDQLAIYLSVAGVVEFITPTPDDLPFYPNDT